MARWCNQAIELGQPRSEFTPLVVGPRQVPRLDAAMAERAPYAALLSAVAHGREPDSASVVEAVWAALSRFSEDERRVWVEMLVSMLDETARKILEDKMNIEAIKEQLPYFIEGRNKGKAEGLAAGKAEGKAEGEAKGLRETMADLCEVLGIEVNDERQAQLEALDLDGLRALRAHLKAHRSWP